MIPDWVLVGEHSFNKIKKEVYDSVNKKLGPVIESKKVSYIHLKHFLEDITHGKFNNTEEARKWYVENILHKYEMKVRKAERMTDAAEEMINTYDNVKKNYRTPLPPPNTTDMPERRRN